MIALIKKIFQKALQRKLLTGIILILLGAGFYFGYQWLDKNNGETRYLTAVAAKGSLIVSVSGSGQVSASDQADIKSEVSGLITALSISQGQEVKKGQILAQIDSQNARQSAAEAEVALESAKIKLEEMESPPDALSLLRADNALSQAERDLEKAQKDYENIEADVDRDLVAAYEDGYSNVSAMFFKISGYMDDLKNVLGTEESEQEYVWSYRLILGQDSPFVSRLLDDYYSAKNLYDENFLFFRGVFRNSGRDTIYKLVSDTLKTTKAISQCLEDARHMYDAIVSKNYQRYFISSVVDKTQPQIESDLSAIFSNVDSLQNIVDSIDQTVENAPDMIKDAELAFKSAQEKLEDKKTALEDLKAGADDIDIRNQRNIVAQKEQALLSAKEDLSNCFIRAPFNGVVAKIYVKSGDTVSSNAALATLITKQQIAEIDFNEIDAAKIKTGQKAVLSFDAVEDLSISGEVITVDSIGAVSQGVVSYNVKIAFDTQNERIKPGMSVSADIIIEAKQDVLVLSSSAVKQQAGVSYVQIVVATASISGSAIPDSDLRVQEIQTGLTNDTMTEITNGLEEGDIIVVQAVSSGSSDSSSSSGQTRQTGNSGFGGQNILRLGR